MRCSAWALFLAMLFFAAPASALEQVTLQLKWTHAFQFAGYYAALEQGYYREAGLDVRLVEGHAGIDPVQRVLAGQAQYGVGTSGLLLARNAKRPVVALAVIFQHSPLVLIARQGQATPSIHDLLDKRLMLEPQSDELLAYLRQEGIPLQRIALQQHSFDIHDFAAGKTDAISAYSTNEPFHLDALGVRYQIFTPRSAGIDFYGDTLFTSERELEMYPHRAEAFRAASLRGWKYAMENPERMIDLIVSRYAPKLSRDFLHFEAKAMAPLLRTDLIEVGYMNPGRWRHIADAYADLGLLPANFPLEGFLYVPETPFDWRRVLPYALAGLVLLLTMGALSAYIVRTNRALKSSVERLHHAHAIAEQTLAAQRQFIAMVSHEFRSSLAVIDNAAQLLAVKLDAANEVHPILARIRRGIERLTGFLENCLTEDRLNCDGLNVCATHIDLAQLAASVRERKQASTDDRRIVVEIEAGLAPMYGDPQLLSILLVNLIGNAIKYSPPESEIRLRMARSEDGVCMEVIDQGQGIAADELPHLFEKYWRGRTAAKVAGAGLGLAIVARIVELHGGTIRIDSEEGVGTRVMLNFPAGRAEAAAH